MQTARRRRRSLALGTGASSGIGLELARQFADTKVGASDKDDPADVARDGFEALMAGEERVISHSLKTKLQGRASRLLPDSAKAAMHRDMADPGSGRR